MNDMTPAGIGHNSEDVSELVKALRASNAELFAQVQELIDRAATVPSKIEDDQTHEKALELLKKGRVVHGMLESTRKVEVEPHKQKVDETNGVFKTRKEALEKAFDPVKEASESYLKAKAAAEKRRLEEEAEKRRIEAERLQREAAEAEAARLTAQRAREEEERKAREAEEARARAIKEKEEAERRAEEERLKAIKMAEERKLAEAAEAERRRIAKEQQAKDEADAAARKEQERIDRETHEARMAKMREEEQAAKDARRKADEEAAAARARADEERRIQRDAEDKAAAARRDEKSAGRDSRDALDAAVREDRKADKIEEKVAGPEADLARSRSEHGAVGTLTRRWECTLVDRQKITPNAILALFPFINEEAISAAGYKFMMAQAQDKRSLPGFTMEEVTSGAVR
jgi:hypothetical protein